MSGIVDLRPLFPAIILSLAGVVLLVAQAFTPKGKSAPSVLIALGGLLGALAAVYQLFRGPRGLTTGGSVVADDFSLFLHALLLGVGILAVLLSPSYLKANGLDRGEYYALLLFSIVGMLGLVSCVELVSLFVALEIMSIAIYGLAGMNRARMESQESALKYFVTGAFSSAFFLYGVALVYGVTGSTSLPKIKIAVAVLSSDSLTLALLGTGFLLVGFGFKVASVPFHMWAPDVYEGAPTTVTALMSAGVKAAAFGGLLRVFAQGLPALSSHWQPLVAVLAIVTMVGGNLGALGQSNLKRMLAWSSVAHAGYLLTAVVALQGLGAEAVLFYLVAYAAVNLGGFGVLSALSRDGREPLSLTDMAGLADRRPVLAMVLTIFLISLTGVPVSAGFVGKFYLFNAAVSSGYVILAIVGGLMSAVSAYYYLRVVVAMYMREPVSEDHWGKVTPASALALFVSVTVVLVLGVYPAPVLALARRAAQSLLLF